MKKERTLYAGLVKVAAAGLKELDISVGIAGRKRNLLLALAKKTLPSAESSLERIEIGDQSFVVNLKHENELLFAYFGQSMIGFFRKSPLYRYMKETLKRGDLFIDIGANLGLYSYLSKECGAESVMFEPEPNHFEFLKRNEEVLGRSFNVALSDVEGMLTFYLADKENPGAHSLVSSGEAGLVSSIKVQTARFDRIVNERSFSCSAVRLIKIDVEGAEEKVVNGMRGFFEEGFRPDIWCEVRGAESTRAANTWKPVVEFFMRYGYEPFASNGRKFTGEEAGQLLPPVFDLLFTTRTWQKGI